MSDDVLGPPEQRGSMRPVTVEGDTTGRSYSCEVRAASDRTGLSIGAIVWVEFGITWATINGKQVRQPGQWRQAVVVAGPEGTNQASGVHVRLSPNPRTAPEKAG